VIFSTRVMSFILERSYFRSSTEINASYTEVTQKRSLEKSQYNSIGYSPMKKLKKEKKKT
jgi:hypothetical protein